MRRSPSSKRSGARSAGPTISICGRAGTGRLGASLSPAFIDLSPLPTSAVHRRAGGNVQTLIGSEPETQPPRPDRDLAAQFDDAVRRPAEIFPRAFRTAPHQGEKLFAHA